MNNEAILVSALNEIVNIRKTMAGLDWVEIEKAQQIAKTAMAQCSIPVTILPCKLEIPQRLIKAYKAVQRMQLFCGLLSDVTGGTLDASTGICTVHFSRLDVNGTADALTRPEAAQTESRTSDVSVDDVNEVIGLVNNFIFCQP